MKFLDLHGVRHEDVEKIVSDFVHQNEIPFEIITGNSSTMKDLAREALQIFELRARQSPNNYGRLIVVEM